ncbi:hypothetical protein NDU88_010168 [Pleurodeles waltl]|uniref:Uncharacterized protein n=1 Tax=Pleurodeles waltl TaxID=8319 RepID=A0AAV7QTP7_PLEWA|nr:hypothetical protein NDU88_010168 [Pleurodeles waltl]
MPGVKVPRMEPTLGHKAICRVRDMKGGPVEVPGVTARSKTGAWHWSSQATRVRGDGGVEHRMETMEDHVHTVLVKDQELLFLRSKLIDLENRSRRDNIRLFRFPEHEECTDIPVTGSARS